MTWIAVVLLALAAFAIAAFAFGLARNLWTSLLAALALGLAGYALQARPELPSAPRAQAADESDAPFDIVEARQEMVGSDERSGSDLMVPGDAMARRGRYAEAAEFYGGITSENPDDFEAWLAQGNALVEHTDGALTPASLYAYRRAAALRPEHLAPGYFLGVSLIRQGRMMEARQVWRDTLATGPQEAAGRDALIERLLRLETMLGVLPADAEGGEADMNTAPESAD